jgi:predicted dienelactone hydrolase
MFKSGFIEGKTFDPNRSDWAGSGKRPLSWAAWYPVSADTETREKLDAAPEHAYFSMGPVAAEAPICRDNETWPLVLFSHGTGGSVQGTGWIARQLAEQGFIVLGVNHHGNNSREPYLPEGFLTGWERTVDLSAILDQAGNLPIIAERINHDRVFALGFSFGGATVISLAGAINNQRQFVRWLESGALPGNGPREFPDLGDHFDRLFKESEVFRSSITRSSKSYKDKRIKAVVALAPGPPVRGFTAKSLKKISIPIKIMTGEADQEAPFDSCSLWLKEQNGNFDLMSLGKDIGHYTLAGICTELCKKESPELSDDLPGVDRALVHERAAHDAAGFFHSFVEPKNGFFSRR